MQDEIKTIKELFPDWTPVRIEGKGANGTVYRLMREAAGETLYSALKVAVVSSLDPGVAEREFAVAKKLGAESPNICTMYDAKVQDGRLYVHMEALSKPAIPNSADALAQVLRMGVDILLALEAIHGEGYVHLDVKPKNILVGGSGPNLRYRLCDFGLTQRVPDRNDKTVIRAGTPAYMSPEMYRYGVSGSRQLFLSDLYSLALTLYYYLNESHLPFEDNRTTADEAFERRMTLAPDEPLPPPKHTTPALTAFLSKLLCAPENRYQSAHDARLALMDVINGLPDEDFFIPVQIDEFLEAETAQSGMTISPKYRLKDCGLVAPDYPVHENRRQEIAAVLKSLNEEGIAFISGHGGIGKTEVAIAAAGSARGTSGAFLIHFEDSVRKTVSNLEFVDCKFTAAADDLGEYEQRKFEDRLNILCQYYAQAVLIVDNFDSEEKSLDELRREPAYQALVKTGIRLIFTTRFDCGHRIGQLPDEELLKLMRYYAPSCPASDEELLQIVEAVHGHTLTLVLIAKTIDESFYTLTAQQVLEALHRTENDKPLPKVGSDYNRDYTQADILSHLMALFDISGLPQEARHVACFGTLLPADGMPAAVFSACLSDVEKMWAKKLLRRGWLESVGVPAVIRMHPVICDCFRRQAAPEAAVFAPFLDRLQAQHCDNAPETLLATAAYVFAAAAAARGDDFEMKTVWRSFAASLFLRAERYREAIVNDLFCLPRLNGGDWSPAAARALTENPAYLCKTEFEQRVLAQDILLKLCTINSHAPIPGFSKEDLYALYDAGNYFDCLAACNVVLRRLSDCIEPPEEVCKALAEIYARLGMNRTAANFVLQGLWQWERRQFSPSLTDVKYWHTSSYLSIMEELYKKAGNTEKQLDYTLASTLLHIKGDISLTEHSTFSEGEAIWVSALVASYARVGLQLCEHRRYQDAARLTRAIEEYVSNTGCSVDDLSVPIYDELKAQLADADL